jgi:hypothetical protein
MESSDDWKVVTKKPRPVKQPEASLSSSSPSSHSNGPPRFASLSNIYAPRTSSPHTRHQDPPRFGSFKNGFNHSSGGSTGYKGNKSFHSKNTKAADFNIPQFLSPEEESKFTTLQKEIPHIMMPGHIRKIQRKINIDNLAEKLLSDEWIEYQRKGWAYERVIKPDETGNIPDGDGYDILPLGNKWGDIVLFKKA